MNKKVDNITVKNNTFSYSSDYSLSEIKSIKVKRDSIHWSDPPYYPHYYSRLIIVIKNDAEIVLKTPLLDTTTSNWELPFYYDVAINKQIKIGKAIADFLGVPFTDA